MTGRGRAGADESGPDVLGDDVEPERRWSLRSGSLRRLGRMGRWVGGALALAVMALAIAGLRAGVRPEADPIGAAGPTVAPRPSHSGAPYDYLPGRTRIPDPQPVDGAPGEVGGVLPVTGPESGQGTALDAVTMVLGYYCRRSGSGERRITAVDDGYRNLEVVAVNRQRPAITLRLHWTGKAYEWKAIKGELLSCP